MSSYAGQWALCGGWAADYWLGRQTREHADVDLVIFTDDLAQLTAQFPDRLVIAHDPPDQTHEDPWDGRALRVPSHIHVRPKDGDVELDLQVNERTNGLWILNAAPHLAIDLRHAIIEPSWGVPVVAPEVVLFFKSDELRPRDEADFRALRPALSKAQTQWLRDAITLVRPGHVWLDALSAAV